jgi:hypothetical protein
MFYTGMLASGVEPMNAKIMYAAVYHFGPRWRAPSRAEERPRETSADVVGNGCVPGRSTVCARSAEEALALHDRLGFPLERTLTEENFEKLADEIQRQEKGSSGGMTLEQIRQYR